MTPPRAKGESEPKLTPAPEGYVWITMTRWTCPDCGDQWEDSQAITARCFCGSQMDPEPIKGLRKVEPDAPKLTPAAPEPFPALKLNAERLLFDAIVEHEPRKVFALFSGGNDSAVLTSWARITLGQRLDAAVFIDTGTALPGVREFVEDFCANRYIPLLTYEAGDAYDVMVRERGFPGPAAHRYAYVRLKERGVDALVREHKQHPRDRILLLTGVRRAESVRRMGTTEPVRRDGSQVWVAPLIDWTDGDMRAYRARHGLEQSDVAALLHRSGECNCGAFAAPGEREELRSLFPTWFEQRIAPLEAATGARWGERPLSVVPDPDAGPMCGGCQMKLTPAESEAA